MDAPVAVGEGGAARRALDDAAAADGTGSRGRPVLSTGRPGAETIVECEPKRRQRR